MYYFNNTWEKKNILTLFSAKALSIFGECSFQTDIPENELRYIYLLSYKYEKTEC